MTFLNWGLRKAEQTLEAWSYKKKKQKKNNTRNLFLLTEPAVKRCLLILDLKPLRS